MPNIIHLYAEESSLETTIASHLKDYHSKKMELMEIESALVEARERLRNLKEAIRIQYLSEDISSTIDEHREAQIIGYRARRKDDEEANNNQRTGKGNG